MMNIQKYKKDIQKEYIECIQGESIQNNYISISDESLYLIRVCFVIPITKSN